MDGDTEGDADVVGVALGRTEGNADGGELGLPVGRVDGVDDGPEDFSTHSRLPTTSSYFSDQQHLAVPQITFFLEFLKHWEMKSAQIAL